VEGFESRRDGGFVAYLRRIVMNRIRDEIRAARRRPERRALVEGLREDGPSPLEAAIGREGLEHYERGLEGLSETQREAVIMRLEMGFSHLEIAEALSLPTPNAARMLVARAVVRLGELVHGKA